MKYFGTVKSFDTIKGLGEIKQESGHWLASTTSRAITGHS
jgi:hypothetical protein